MNNRSLAALLTFLVIAIALTGLKAFSGRANSAPGDQVKNNLSQPEAAQSESTAPDEMAEYTKHLPPPKSMTGISGVSTFWIRNVLPNSPADLAGLKPGDLIELVDGKELSSIKVMLGATQKAPGTIVTFDVIRYNTETKEYDRFKVTMPTAQWNHAHAER